MKILVGITGSIAAYKSYEVVRGLVNRGHAVKVILTKGAEEFIRGKVFLYLGAEQVYYHHDDFNHAGVLHVTLRDWADRIIVAPLSSNSLNKIAQNLCDDLLSTVVSARLPGKPLILFPAMNTQMLEKNLMAIDKLKRKPDIFIHPTQSGELACGEIGNGKLSSIENIIDVSENYYPEKANSRHVVITTGATIEPMDPVRYLTNAANGLTGFYLAAEAMARGDRVTVIAGKNSTERLDHLQHLPQFTLHRVTTAEEMLALVKNEMPAMDVFIAAAAVSDFSFKTNSQKIKRTNLTQTLEIIPAPDILDYVIKNKTKKTIVVGFAAETQLTEEMLQEKYSRKPVNLLIGTQVDNGLLPAHDLQGFQASSAKYLIFDGDFMHEQQLSKNHLAKFTFDHLTGKI